MNKTTRAPARSRRKGQPIAEGEPRARDDAEPTTPASIPADAPSETLSEARPLSAMPSEAVALPSVAPSPEDTPTLKAVRAIRPRTPRKADVPATGAVSKGEEPEASASMGPRPDEDARQGENAPENAPENATLAEAPSPSSQPSQPSQSTTKLHTLAIMAEVARRASAGNTSDPHAPTTPEAEAGIAPSAFLPPIPESLKERLRAPLAQASAPEESDRGFDTDVSQDASPDSPGATLSRLAIRADVARLALRESLRRQHHASQSGTQSGTQSGEDLISAADQDSATQVTRPTPQRARAAEGTPNSAPGHRPLPTVDLLPLLTTLHAGIGATAALVAVVLLLARSPLVALVLALAGLAGGSSMLAPLLTRPSAGSSARQSTAGIVLLGSQFAMLAWAFVLLGPRAALLFLVPAMALWALRVLGRGALGVVLVGTLLLYSFAAVLLLSGLLVPALALGSSVAIVLDGALAALGLALTLGGVEGLLRATLRARARARARELDVAYLRSRLGALERETALDEETLRTTLRRAIRLRRAIPLAGTGPLVGLYPTLNTAMERVATLSRDREERLRLEGALRRLIQAVEKSWLGLSWSWPEESGTLLDELVALLRTPSLDRQPVPPAGDDDPERSALPWPLVPIPSAEVERERLRAEATPPHIETRHALREFTPPPGGASSARWTPWA